MANIIIDSNPLLPLEDLKKHLNVDYNEDDNYIETLGKTALAAVVKATRRDIPTLKAMNGGTFPLELSLACKMLVAHWYKNRENVSTVNQTSIPHTYDYLVKPYVRLGRC